MPRNPIAGAVLRYLNMRPDRFDAGDARTFADLLASNLVAKACGEGPDAVNAARLVAEIVQHADPVMDALERD